MEGRGDAREEEVETFSRGSLCSGINPLFK
jgi:hypothetical protein